MGQGRQRREGCDSLNPNYAHKMINGDAAMIDRSAICIYCESSVALWRDSAEHHRACDNMRAVFWDGSPLWSEGLHGFKTLEGIHETLQAVH